MEKIRRLKNKNNSFVPLTHTKAVVDDNGNSVDSMLNDLYNKVSPEKFDDIVKGVSVESIDVVTVGARVYDTDKGLFLNKVAGKYYYNNPDMVLGFPVIGKMYICKGKLYVGTVNGLMEQSIPKQELGDDEMSTMSQKTLTEIIAEGYKYVGSIDSLDFALSELPQGKVFYTTTLVGFFTNLSVEKNFSGLAFVKFDIVNSWEIVNLLEIKQEMGNSTDSPMSQKAVTDELNKKFDKSNLLNTTGQSEIGTMTQKVITDELNKKTEKTVFSNFENSVNSRFEAIKPTIVQGNVTNLPDDEDITTTIDNKLRFKDRIQTPSLQMGYVVLRKDKTFKEQVEGKPNTIFEIRYDFDLGGNEVEKNVKIGNGCVLYFFGGSVSNGVIIGNNTKIDGIAHLYTNFKGSFLGSAKISWFLKNNDINYNAHDDLVRAMKYTFLTTGEYYYRKVLDMEGIPITIEGEVEVMKEMFVQKMVNGNIRYIPQKSKESLFRFNSTTADVGKNYIENFTIDTYNPNNYTLVNAFYFENWWSDAGWKFEDVKVRNLSGYIFVNTSYLQEGHFLNIKGDSCGGFLSYNTDKAFSNKLGSSNILSFRNICMDNMSNRDITSSKYVPYLVNLSGCGHVEFEEIVFQGTGSDGIKIVNIDNNIGGVNNVVTFRNLWVEFVNKKIDGAIDINISCRLDIEGTYQVRKINIKQPHPQPTHVSLYLGGSSINSLQELINGINIDEKIELNNISINVNSSLYGQLFTYFTPKINDLLFTGVIKNFMNSTSPGIQPTLNFNVGVANYTNSIVKTIEKTKSQFGDNYGAARNSLIDVDGCYVFEHETIKESGWDISFIFQRNNVENELINPNKFALISNMVWRMCPTVEITEENKDTVGVSSSAFNGNFGTGGNPKRMTFPVGTKPNEFTPWQRLICVNKSDGFATRFDTVSVKLQVAQFEYIIGQGNISTDVIIDKKNDKLISNYSNIPIICLDKDVSVLKPYLKSEKVIYESNGDLYKYANGVLKKITGEIQ